MNTRTHIHEEVFTTSPEKLFALLHTPSAIRQWWSASRVIVLPEVGGLWAAAWGDDEDHPEYQTIASISVFEPPSRLFLSEYRYHSRDGQFPFEANFTSEFLISAHPEGALLKVIQDGFPAGADGDKFLAACEKGWTDTFAGIRSFLASQ